MVEYILLAMRCILKVHFMSTLPELLLKTSTKETDFITCHGNISALVYIESSIWIKYKASDVELLHNTSSWSMAY